ncbi:MAG TPA: hypothetical protein VJM34_02030 [Novosphingobium sp.]|nr:hypothetical protein [Novosphingobium sp.]
MEQYQKERALAEKNIASAGLDPADFTFEMEYLEPDPDGGGMFTLQYEIRVMRQSTGTSLTLIGGIGSDWVGYLDEAVRTGHFN